MNNAQARWISAVTHYAKSAIYCVRVSPLATVGATMLFMFFKASIVVSVRLRAELIRSLDIGGESRMSAIAFCILIFCIFTMLYRFRGYVTLTVNRIIEATVSRITLRRIMSAYSALPLEQIDAERTNTEVQRSREKADELQGDIMMFADALAGLVSIIVLAINLLTYRFGALFVLAAVMIGTTNRLASFRFTERETELDRRLTLNRRVCEYLFRLQTERASSLELKVDRSYRFLRERWDILGKEAISKRMNLRRWHYWRNFRLGLCAEILHLLVFSMLILQVLVGRVELSDFVFLSAAILSTSSLVETLIKSVSYGYRAGARFEPLERLIQLSNSAQLASAEDKAPRPAEQQEPLHKTNGAPVLQLVDVSFSYDGVTEVLKNVDFELGQNEIVALVGPNGGGKSTLVKLALGLLRPNHGAVRYRGQGSTYRSVPERTDSAGAVFQDFQCYSLTLRDNVGFGDWLNMGNDSAVRSAIERGDCEDLLQKVPSLDTYLGREFDENGIEPSRGEWQRVAIARAFMKSHQFYAFDEPAAAIDPLAEYELFNQIRRYLSDRSSILVTHRIGLCKIADRIVYLSDGRIVESGTHEELLSMEGSYATLHREQSQWYDFRANRGRE